MPAFSITQDKVACWDKEVTPSAYDTCCCFLLLTSNSSTAPEEAVCGLPRASDPLGPLGPCIPWPSFTILFQEHRDRVQEPKHQLPNGLLEALRKQHQGAQFFFFFLLLSLFSLSVCQPGQMAVALQSHFLFLQLISFRHQLISLVNTSSA